MMIESTMKLQMRIFEALTARQSRSINLDNASCLQLKVFKLYAYILCKKNCYNNTQKKHFSPWSLVQVSVRVSWHISEKISSQELDPDQHHIPHAEKQSIPFSFKYIRRGLQKSFFVFSVFSVDVCILGLVVRHKKVQSRVGLFLSYEKATESKEKRAADRKCPGRLFHENL